MTLQDIQLRQIILKHQKNLIPQSFSSIRGYEFFSPMNKFSLHTPPKRHNLWEWVYHELLKEEGLPTIKYNFVNLILNGENLGVYAI